MLSNSVRAAGQNIPVSRVKVADLTLAAAQMSGSVDGSATGRYELRGERLAARFQVAKDVLKVTEVENLKTHAKRCV